MLRTKLLDHGRACLAALVLATVAAPSTGSGAPLVPPSAAVDPALRTDAVDVPVVVQARPGRTEEAVEAAGRAGARVGLPLPIVDGFTARVSGPTVAALAGSPHVAAVTLDRSGAFHGGDAASAPSTGSAYTVATGASTAWSYGLVGTGVTVAVLDTGISPMPDVADRTFPGPDLSGERTPIDTYGHGTVMAGIIAGDGRDSQGARRGVAPDARLVGVKVAGRNGAVDVSTVLMGMAWVAAHREKLGIRVLNLSYGTSSTQDPAVDPLNVAVQRLWAQGIVVVVAAGNGGPGPGTITKPADDPVVLTVGAYDDRGDASPENDLVPAWSSRGPTAQGVAKPDLVAPGRTLVATRSYGSAVEGAHPDSLVAPSYVKASGTSQAAAVTSGLVALLLQAHPTWTPDQVKRALSASAAPLPDAPVGATGRGRAQLLSALWADPGPPVQQPLTAAGARPGSFGVDGTGTADPWTGNSWTGNSWTGNSWTGNSWTWQEADGNDGPLLTAFWGDGPKPSEPVAGEAPVGEAEAPPADAAP